MKGDCTSADGGSTRPFLSTDHPEEEKRKPCRSCQWGVWRRLDCSGDMVLLDTYVRDLPSVLQLVLCVLRGVSRVVVANNPLSGALVLAAVFWSSPWQGLLGTVGVLASTLTAVLIGQDRWGLMSILLCVCNTTEEGIIPNTEIHAGLHGYNGILVAILIGVFSSVGDWFWWLLLPAGVAAAASTVLYSGLVPVMDRWDLPVSVYPFNMVVSLYLLAVQPNNPYLPHYQATPAGELEPNATELDAAQLIQGIFLGVGQILACDALGPSLLILGAVMLYSPLLAMHALLGSTVGTLAGLSVAVRHGSLYSGLSGFNGALGCMCVGGYFFTLSWRTHLFAIATAFICSYVDIALSNLLGTVGLPACSWAATLVVSVMLLLTGQALSRYRIPLARIMSPEHSLCARSQWKDRKTAEPPDTCV